MTSQAASIGSLISAFILSDHRILKISWETPFSKKLGPEDLREPTYLAYQSWAARSPDHVFDSAWCQQMQQINKYQCITLTVLDSLCKEFLEVRHGKIHMRRILLGPWQQGIASRISSLPIQAAADIYFSVRNHVVTSASPRFTSFFDIEKKVRPNRQALPILKPDEAVVSDYIEREGLHETHLHLNGSTHAEICWLRAIQSPRAETRKFVKAWQIGSSKSRLRELIEQVSPGLTPKKFFHHLIVAYRLKVWLTAFATDQISSSTQLPNSCSDLCSVEDETWYTGISRNHLACNKNSHIHSELHWMSKLVDILRQKPNNRISRIFHTYILLSNEYYKLLVQSESQYGFDQFQKFTLTELRDPAEQDYKDRYDTMHGASSSVSTIGYLEGRFSPKNDPSKAISLFQSILGGYLTYLKEVSGVEKPANEGMKSLSKILTELEEYFEDSKLPHRSVQRLALVAHFIKQPWPPDQIYKSGPYRHYSLDMQLRKTTSVLISLLERWPKLRTWVRGIDAAANELHAPPDIFAPAYRVCQRAGITHRSYHAGEDFRHLISGISAIWEALTLLQLHNGDRIGHATAMGIKPSLWLDRMPKNINLSHGEWMLNMLTSWQLLRDLPDMQSSAHMLLRELERSAGYIFGHSLSGHQIEQSMALRGLCRQSIKRHFIDQSVLYAEPLSDFWRDEAVLVQEACKNQPEAMNLLWAWLSNPAVLKRSQEWTSKESSFLDTQIYLRMQQALMQAVSDRGVLIETLPSSNVRISQYNNIKEHHSLRWMRVPGHIEEGDPEIMVCLGSDDPGIFAGDLETEFYLLYSTLRELDLSDVESLQRLKNLNERGRIYRFHHRSLS